MTQAICDITTDEVNVDVVVEPQADTMVEVANRAGGMEQVFHDNTLIGNGNSIDLGVNTDIIATKEYVDENKVDAYTKTEVDNKFTVANAQIDANATAILKTRDDMNEEDGRLQTQITAHADAITALQNEQTATGNQIQTIESKIPDGTSDTNPLINKQQLLDEEMDIRDDLNEGLSELQTQITAQAAEIATKQDQLTAGDNIVISGNVISATGAGGGAGFDIVVVQELPATGQKGIIYLLAKDGTAPDVYDEYVWITATQTFELIGTTQVDLSGYLPLAGGTMAGNIEFAQPETGSNTYRIQFYQLSANLMYRLGSDGSGSYRGFGIGVLKRSSGDTYSYGARYAFTENEFTSYDHDVSLGCSNFKWLNVYAKKLNNGADIAIPTTGGTMALVEDIAESVTTKDLTVGTDEGTLNIGVTAGVATIATNNGLDIVAQTKFDTAPTTDDNTTYANALDTSLVRKAQVATAISDALSSFEGGTKVIFREWE